MCSLPVHYIIKYSKPMNECTLVKPISLHTPNHQFFFGRTRDLHQGVLKNVNKTVFILRVISVL